jgi:hypothetical protein
MPLLDRKDAWSLACLPVSQLSGEDPLMATMVAGLRASGVAIFRFDIRKSKT